jgi:Plasmid pRiA4b ORF-3-like protein
VAKTVAIHQYKITLKNIRPAIWRRIQVPADYSFWDLHVAIQDAMGWLDYHLHAFRLGNTKTPTYVGLPESPDDDSMMAGWEMPLESYFKVPGAIATYDYDFGDGWEHQVLFEAALLREKGMTYPTCTAGKRACPPEDCGGIGGYEQLLRTLQTPKTMEYQEVQQWLKGHAKNYWPFDPASFQPQTVQFDDPAARLEAALSP